MHVIKIRPRTHFVEYTNNGKCFLIEIGLIKKGQCVADISAYKAATIMKFVLLLLNYKLSL